MATETVWQRRGSRPPATFLWSQTNQTTVQGVVPEENGAEAVSPPRQAGMQLGHEVD